MWFRRVAQMAPLLTGDNLCRSKERNETGFVSEICHLATATVLLEVMTACVAAHLGALPLSRDCNTLPETTFSRASREIVFSVFMCKTMRVSGSTADPVLLLVSGASRGWFRMRERTDERRGPCARSRRGAVFHETDLDRSVVLVLVNLIRPCACLNV